MLDFSSPKTQKLLRLLSFIEGTSLLLLFFVAMPLKYLAGEPKMVSIVGMTHGLLFIALVTMIILVSKASRWPKGLFWLALISSTIPFGMFVLDYKLKTLKV